MPKPAKHKRSGPKSTRAGCLMCKPQKRQGCSRESVNDQRRAPAAEGPPRHAPRRAARRWSFSEKIAARHLDRYGKLLWTLYPKRDGEAMRYQRWLWTHRPEVQSVPIGA